MDVFGKNPPRYKYMGWWKHETHLYKDGIRRNVLFRGQED